MISPPPKELPRHHTGRKPHRRLRRHIPQISWTQIRSVDQHIRAMLRMLQARAVSIQIHAPLQIALMLLSPDICAMHSVFPYRRVVVKWIDSLRHGLEVKFFFSFRVVKTPPVHASLVVFIQLVVDARRGNPEVDERVKDATEGAGFGRGVATVEGDGRRGDVPNHFALEGEEDEPEDGSRKGCGNDGASSGRMRIVVWRWLMEVYVVHFGVCSI